MSALFSMRRAMMSGMAVTLALAAPVHAQSDKMAPIPIPAQPTAIPLNTGKLPNATAPEAWHSQYGSVFARNVVQATLTPFLPDPAKASGAAVIVAPGGGFRTLSMENEGWDVAKALAEKGIAAFVLKYRLNQTPADMAAFANASNPPPPGSPRGGSRPGTAGMMASIAPMIADANAAFALVRSRAGEWKIDQDRIGMVGFSAGAMLTMATAMEGKAKPAFLGDIYGPLTAMPAPADAPPLFVALAADDPLFRGPEYGLIDAWRNAKRPVEFHLYEQGGHGFGMYQKATTSTGWFEAFAKWLDMHGFTKAKA
jgi:acetyl esterase/lipase